MLHLKPFYCCQQDQRIQEVDSGLLARPRQPCILYHFFLKHDYQKCFRTKKQHHFIHDN